MILTALLRFLWRTPWSTLMALAGVTLGVVSIVAVHLISQRIGAEIDTLTPAPLQTFNYLARSEKLTGGDYFELVSKWLSGEVALDRVEALTPVIDETLILHSTQEQALRLFGFDFFVLRDQLDVVESSPEVDPLYGVWLGSDVDPSLFAEYVINGRLAVPGIVVADIGLAQQLLQWSASDRLSYVALRDGGGGNHIRRNLELLLPGASAGLPEPPPPVLPAPYVVESIAKAHPASEFGRSILFNVSALASLAMLVAWFLIYQVAVFWLRRLAGIFTRFSVLGVSEVALGGYFLLLMGIVAVAAAGLGLFGGHFLATLMLDFSLGGSNTLSLDRWVIFKAIFSAFVVCLGGGLWAYLSRVRSPLHISAISRLALATLMGVGIVLGLSVDALDLAGAFAAIALLSFVLLVYVKPILNFFKARSRHLSMGLLWRLSLREVVWYPRDLTIAVAALSLAVATAIGVGLMVDSLRSDFVRMLDNRLSYDFALSADSDVLAAELDQLKQNSAVTRTQTYRSYLTRIESNTVEIVASQVDVFEAARYGYRQALAPHEVLISEQLSIATGKSTGDEIVFGEVNWKIVHIFQSFGDTLPRVIRQQQDTDLGIPISEIRVLSSGSSPPSPADWQGQRDIRETALDVFDRTFIITSVLIALAIAVAGLGVYVAVTVMRLNQQASARLLEGLGLTPIEIRSMDLARGVGVGALAILLALPLGLSFGWILCEVVNPRAFGWSVNLQPTVNAFVIPAGWGMLAAVIASLVRVGAAELTLDNRVRVAV